MLIRHKNFILGFFTCFFVLNIVSFSIPIQTVNYEDSNSIALELLRGFRISKEENRSNQAVSRLMRSPRIELESSEINFQANNNFSIGIHHKIQGPGGGTIEDYVDLTSDVDSSPDLGSHDLFSNIQATDSIYDNMTEVIPSSGNTHSWDAPGGFGNFLQVGSGGLTDFGSTSGTISLWLKFDSISGRFWGQHTDFEIRFGGIGNSELHLDWGVTDALLYTHGFTTNTWYFWAVTWDEIANTIYIYEGDENNQPSQVASTSTWTGAVSTIGVIQNNIMNSRNSGYEVDGHVDDFRYYDTDRSLSAIQNDYKTKLSGSESNLVHYYEFDNDLTDSAGSSNCVEAGSGGTFSTDVPSGFSGGGTGTDYQLDLEAQFAGVYDSGSIAEELCIKTGSFGGIEDINVTYWDGDSWELITSDLTASTWNNFTVTLTSPTFTIKFGGSTTSTDSIQDWWEIDSVLLIVEGPEQVLGDDSGFIWLDSPDEVNLGMTYSSWVQQDLSDDSIPSNATGVILTWVEDSIYVRHAVARGSQDTNDFMNGGSNYCRIEEETWRMQIVKLSEHKYIDTWRQSASSRLYVMGYTVGSDPQFKRVASDLGSLTADSSWNKITISGVDDTTTGVILFGQSTSDQDATILVRAVGSTDSMTFREWEEYNCGVFFVKIDANDQFEYYITSGRAAKFFLIAEVKDSIDWLDTNRDSISAPYPGWTIRDLDSYSTVPSNASGVILQYESTGGYADYKNIARKYGQSWTFPRYDVGGDQWLMGGSGIDSENRIQIYAESIEQDIYIHALTLYTDKTPPVIDSFGVDDPGDGNPTFWANVTDSFSTVTNVKLLLNGIIEVDMSKNASDIWIYQPLSINYDDYYTYQIVNASDTFDNTLKKASIEGNHTFDYDTIAPNVDDWAFFTDEGPYGTFKANVSDSWGKINTVIVNVTYHENMGDLSALWAIMQNTTSGFMNNTLVMIEGSINFVVKVNDTKGNTYTSSEHPGYAPNLVPIAENVSLSRDAFSEELPVTSNDTLYLLYDYFDAEGYTESGTEIRWYLWNGTEWKLQPAYNDETQIPSSALVRGEIWNATVKPRDGKDFGDMIASEIIITIQNSAPATKNVIIYPSDPLTGNTLTASYDWIDPDPSDIEQGSLIRWYCDYRNGSGFLELTNFENQTEVPPSATNKSYIFYYIITPYDGQNFGVFTVSNQITIGNTPPTLIVDINNNTIPAEILSTDDLIANYTYFDADSDPNESLEIRWYIYSLGSWVLNYTNTLVIKSGNTTNNDLWRVEMNISDGTNFSGWISSATMSIGVPPNKPPEALMVNLTLSNQVAGGYLNVSYTYSDPDGDNEGITIFRWYRNDIYQSQFDGPTFKILDIAPLIKGDNWTVEVKPQDIYGDYGNWSTNATIMIENTAPELLSVEIYPSTTAYTTNTLIANYIEYYHDIDNDLMVNLSIVWKNGTKEVPSLNNKTSVPSSYTAKGENWTFVIRVFDGTEWSGNYTSEKITIQNSLMSLDDVTLTGGLNTLDDISVLLDPYINDADGDDLDLARTKINWTVERNGDEIHKVNGTLDLLSTYFVAGDYITVQITPHDGESLGEIWQKYRVYLIIDNAAPTIDGSPYIHGPNNITTIFYASKVLYVNYTTLDPDSGESNALYDIEYDENGLVTDAEYKWFRNGTLVEEISSFFVPISYLSRGDIWNVSVRPRDRWGDFGDWVTSPAIIINNSPPIITEFYEVNLETKSDMDLDLMFIYFDYDGDNITLSETLILWYNNSTPIPDTENGTIIDFDQIGNQIHVRIRLSCNTFSRGDNISVYVQPFDGINWGIEPNISSNIIIVNSLPIVYDVKIQPNGLDLPAYTVDSLNISWDFFDEDDDPVDSYVAFIKWFNKGIEQDKFENSTMIPAINTTKGDSWRIEIQVFDGFDYSIIYTSDPITILNSPPIITEVTIWSSNKNATQTYADTSLILDPIQDINNTDPDQDPILWQYTFIYWFKNGTYQPEYDNWEEIPATEISKGESWFARVQITDDGENWSLNYSSQEIFIVNKAPEIKILKLVGNEFPDFLIEDEDINVSLTLLDIDLGDSDLSFFNWYVNGSYQSQYDNLRLIPQDQTHPGQNWTVQIRPFDGFDNGSLISMSIFIESRPAIQEFVSYIYTESEGLYQFAVKAHDSLDNQIVDVRFEIFLNKSTVPIVNTITNFPNATGYWILPYTLHDFAFLNTNATMRITVRTTVEYSDVFYITNEKDYIFTLLDKSPPRVIDAWFIKDDEYDPTSLIFYAEVEEFGSNISEVILFYYFVPVSETEGTAGLGATVLQTELHHSKMIFQNKSDNVFLYSVTVDFQHNQSDIEIHYRISTRDGDGNINEYAFDNTGLPDQTFRFQSPGLPQWVLLIAGVIIFVIFVGSIVYIKFIRKPELVGLDKELVLQKIADINPNEVINSLDNHTLGVIVSFFDQRHGPIPIIILPELLKDNYSKLVELSDRSFGGTGFGQNFDEEIPSNFDFILAEGIRTSVLSFGFAVERPEARGGQENLTLNILIHKNVFPLLNQFQDEIQDQVHSFHVIMDKDPSKKEKIQKSAFEIRKFVSTIVLSYQNIYGTTELLGEEE
ncbi:MAG: hypothetical protein ACFFB5_18640 [Promethearchaeota archaeon]